MTEPTLDTPESELTGDGLRDRLREAFVSGYANGRAAPSDPTEAAHEAVRLAAAYVDHPATLAHILAALPNREAAPEPWIGPNGEGRPSMADDESDLTGDGLTEARRVADVLVSEGLIAPDIFDYAIRDKDIVARLRLAALPNREAAPREGLDAALRAALLDAAHGCEPECIGGMHVPLEDAYAAIAEALGR